MTGRHRLEQPVVIAGIRNHARASAARSGRDWREDLEIHEFIDSTKIAFADLRHRMILHSVDLGGELTARAFPCRPDAREIARNHVVEDLGEDRSLGCWLWHCQLGGLPRPHPGSLPIDENALLSGEQQRQALANQEGPAAVLEILRLPLRLAPEYGNHAWCVLCNAFGPSLVRRLLGPPRELPGTSGVPVIFDPAWCAEAMIFRIYRAIPEVRSVAAALRPSHKKEATCAAHHR
jgi:hypothetical protein